MVWARSITTGATVATVSPVKQNLLANFETEYGANLIGATVTRIRGVVVAGNNVSPAVSSQMLLAVRVGNDAEASGQLSDGFNQPYLDWMAWEPFIYQALPAAPQTSDSPALSRLIDVKAQRKLEEVNEELQVWVGALNAPFAYSWNLSILLKLP